MKSVAITITAAALTYIVTRLVKKHRHSPYCPRCKHYAVYNAPDGDAISVCTLRSEPRNAPACHKVAGTKRCKFEYPHGE